MRSSKLLRNLILGAVIIAVAFVFSACGGGRRTAPASLSLKTAPAVISINDALAELERTKPPAGVDAALFDQLKDALRSALIARGDKAVCKPPMGNVNIVPDLAFSDNQDGTMNLTWHYYNVGDYNQDNVVSIADITPLAVNFGRASAEGEINTLVAVVDGNGSHTVDIADITPIAVNFGVQFSGYLIEVSDTQGGVYTTEADIPATFGQGIDEGRISFLYNFTPTPEYWYRVTPYDNNETPGVPSLECQAPPAGAQFPVASIIADAVLGFAPLTVNFSANNSYDPDGGDISKYEWDATGDGIFEVDGGTNPLFQYEYTTAALYHPALRVTDDDGLQDTASTTINVVAIPDYNEVEPNNDAPSANVLPSLPVTSYFGSLGKNLPSYLGYDGGLQDWFSFTAAEGETITVFCTFNSSLHVSFQLRDNEGDILAEDLDTDNPQVLTYVFQPGDVAPYFIGLIGTGYSDYSLSIVTGAAPLADIVAYPASGMAPLEVTMDAAASTDDGTIVTYEWDFEGDGFYDLNTGNTPITIHTYDNQGTYNPTVRITDDDTLTDTAQATVEVWASTYGEVENNDIMPEANAMPAFPFSAFTGSLGADPPGYPGYDGDSNDFFSFTAAEGQTYTFRLNYDGGTLQAGMNLYDSTGALIEVSDIYSGTQVFHTFNAGEGGTAIIEVVGVSGYGDYALSGIQGTPPNAELTASPRNGDPPLTPNFDASGSTGTITKYEFDFLGDGVFELDNGNDPTVLFEYDTQGVYVAAVRVTDNNGFADVATYTITVGDTGYDEVEDNDMQGMANQLPMLPVIAYKGSISDSDDPPYTGYDGDLDDWFFFLGPAVGDTVTVTLNYSPTLIASIGLYDADGDYLSGYYGSSPAEISYTFATGDVAPWYVYVNTWEGFGDYFMSVKLGAPPVAVLLAAPPSGGAPLMVNFDASNSHDLDGFITSWDYDWEGEGDYELIGGTDHEAHIYDTEGQYTPTLRVTDNSGYQDTDSRWIFVGAIPYDEREQNDTELESNPFPLFPFSSFSGSVGSSDNYPGYDGDEWDIFSFSASEGDTVDFSLIFNFNVADLSLTLFDSEGDFLGSSDNFEDNEFLSIPIIPGDTSPFYLWVGTNVGGADYSLDGSLT